MFITTPLHSHQNGEYHKMRRSHLERYVEITSLLARYGPLKQTHIMYKANVNYMVLKEDLRFLIKQALVEEETTEKNRTIFRTTKKGINVIKYFQGLKQTSQLLKKSISHKN